MHTYVYVSMHCNKIGTDMQKGREKRRADWRSAYAHTYVRVYTHAPPKIYLAVAAILVGFEPSLEMGFESSVSGAFTYCRW